MSNVQRERENERMKKKYQIWAMGPISGFLSVE